MKLKQVLPHKEALALAVATQSAAITGSVRSEVGHLEADYVKFRRYHRLSVLLVAAAFLLPNLLVFLLNIYFTNLPVTASYLIGIAVGLLSISFCLYYGSKLILSGFDVIQQFHKGVDRIVFNKIFALFGIEGRLITHSVVIDKKPLDERASKWVQLFEVIRSHLRSLKESPESEQVFATLRQSELITEPYNTTRIDNLFEVMHDGRALFVSELDIKNITGSGKNRQVRHLFKGYFVSYKLGRRYHGRTFVSTDGDRQGFGHRNYWNAPTGSETTETLLEWNDFEDLLHVATTNEREAREILTTDFMHDLYAWWKAKSNNIRISFIDDHMYLLFPDEQIRFEETIAEIDETRLQEYLLTIAEPLLHVLHLVEDVRV